MKTAEDAGDAEGIASTAENAGEERGGRAAHRAARETFARRTHYFTASAVFSVPFLTS